MPKAAELDGELRDRAVYLPAAEALVLADLHLGKVAASAIEAPMGAGASMVDRLDALIDQFRPAEVVLAGDLLHSYASIPRAARDTLEELLARIAAAGADAVAIEGNHDPLLSELVDRNIHAAYTLSDGTVVCHGHQVPSTTAERFVIGHDHPAIELQGRRRPCYLQAESVYEGADVLALPAYNPAVRGTVVNGLADGEPLSPFLTNLSRFRPVIRDRDADESLVFPRLDALRPHL
ncbi:MAG: metallophosphoesterase [Halobacteriales archaeon]